jgi:enamine deaminase RidA (YjgF/YER057c/UK114 family)
VAKSFQVTGVGGVPAGATAVTGNLTVTAQTAPGYLYIGPVAMNNPTSSTLNFPTADDRANAVTVALSSTGSLSVTYVDPWSGQSAQAIFDVTGYFTPDNTGATYHPLAPTRLLDSRDGTGLSGVFNAWSARTFQVTGVGGVPAGAIAVTGNLTVTDQSASGYLYMGPTAMNVPTSSTLNFPINDNRANAVTVALSSTGSLSVTYVSATGAATTDVVFDVTGFFTPDATGAVYVPLNPARILDSRSDTGFSGPLATDVAQTFAVTGQGGVPSAATAVTGNLTVTGQDAPGYLYIGPVATNSPM